MESTQHHSDDTYLQNIAKRNLQRVFKTSYPVTGDNLVEKVEFKNKKVFINKEQYFGGVSEEVYNFMIGGYKPAEKYLKDRKGKNLTSDEFENYQKMIVALSESIRIMEEIEGVFEI